MLTLNFRYHLNSVFLFYLPVFLCALMACLMAVLTKVQNVNSSCRKCASINVSNRNKIFFNTSDVIENKCKYNAFSLVLYK